MTTIPIHICNHCGLPIDPVSEGLRIHEVTDGEAIDKIEGPTKWFYHEVCAMVVEIGYAEAYDRTHKKGD